MTLRVETGMIRESSYRMISKTYSKYGLSHLLARGIEFSCLQSRPTAQLYRRLAPIFYRYKYEFDVSEYDVPINPLRIRYVDPQDIDLFSARKDLTPSVREAKYQIGSIMEGTWDLDEYSGEKYTKKRLLYADSLSNTLLFQAMEKRYIEGYEWEETEFFQEIVKHVKRGNRIWHGSTTKSDIEKRCAKIDHLYDNIKENGYMTKKELHGYRPSMDKPFGYLNERLDEVTVDVSRNGDFLLVDSKHRLAIARLLGIEKIPVTVLVRHQRWMEYLDEQFSTGTMPDHPDCVEVQ